MTHHTADTLNELIKKYKKTGEIKYRNEIIEVKKNNIESISNYYWVRFFLREAEYRDDCLQEGYLACIDAIESYRDGGNFESCLRYWIFRRIVNLRLSESVIKISGSITPTIREIKKISEEFVEKNGKEPDFDFIAKKMNLSPRKRFYMRYYVRNQKDDVKISFGEQWLDTEKQDPALVYEQEAFKKDEYNLINKAVAQLKPKELYIIKKRFFNEEKRETFENLGKELGCTTQWVEQIEKKALNKIKLKIKHKI